MNFYIIHNASFPLRKTFLDAQFRRYGISNYEYIEIDSEDRVVSAYVNAFQKISQDETIQCGMVFIDTILLSQNLLEYIYFAHLQMISSETSKDVIFINVSSKTPSTPEKKMKKKILHLTTWDVQDIYINYSSSFMVSKSGAQCILRYIETCIRKSASYQTVDNLFLITDPVTRKAVQTNHSVDLVIFNTNMFYSDRFNVYWLQ